MQGKIKKIIDTIIAQRSKGSSVVANLTRAKLAMKGVICDKYNETSEDDPAVIEKLKQIASELSIVI